MNKNLRNKSVMLSYLLRHNPGDIKMNDQGWVSIFDLLRKLKISKEELDEIVSSNDKKRFGYNTEETKIRAHQGHSLKLGLKIKFKEVQFPKIYYHGTDFMNKLSIEKFGLRPGNRSHVHLSKDIETASKVGFRKGDTVLIFEVDGNQMKRDGYKVYESDNGVILVSEVPPKYLKMYG